jgi:hypothetical protein
VSYRTARRRPWRRRRQILQLCPFRPMPRASPHHMIGPLLQDLCDAHRQHYCTCHPTSSSRISVTASPAITIRVDRSTLYDMRYILSPNQVPHLRIVWLCLSDR